MKKHMSSSVRVSDAQSSRSNLWAQGITATMAALLALALVPGFLHADPRRTEVDPPSPGETTWLSVSDASMPEGDGGAAMLRFTITASPVSADAIQIAYRLVDRSATCSDNDYQAASGVLTIPANQASADLAIAVYGDRAFEADENFWVVLSEPVNALISDAVATGTIFNDDRRGGNGGPRRLPEITESEAGPRFLPAEPPADGAPVVLSVQGSSVREGNAGVTLLRFQVHAEPASSEAISVAWRIADASATCSNQDYQAASGVLMIPAYASSGEISVAVFGDQAFEGDETFTLMLSDALNAQLVQEAAVGTILNDDRRGGSSGPRHLPELGSIGMEGDPQSIAPAPKKATTWGALKVRYR